MFFAFCSQFSWLFIWLRITAIILLNLSDDEEEEVMKGAETTHTIFQVPGKDSWKQNFPLRFSFDSAPEAPTFINNEAIGFKQFQISGEKIFSFKPWKLNRMKFERNLFGELNYEASIIFKQQFNNKLPHVTVAWNGREREKKSAGKRITIAWNFANWNYFCNKLPFPIPVSWNDRDSHSLTSSRIPTNAVLN